MFFINLGLYAGTLTNSLFQGEYDNEQIDKSAKENLNNLVVAFMSTLGLKINLGYSWSLTADMNTRYGKVLIPDSEFKNQLDVFYSIGFLYRLNENSKK